MKIHELFESNNEDLHIKAVNDLKKKLLAKKDDLQKSNNKKLMIEIDRIMKNVARTHGITTNALHDAWMDEYHKIPDKWIVNEGDVVPFKKKKSDLEKYSDEFSKQHNDEHRYGVGSIECPYCGEINCDYDCDESQADGFVDEDIVNEEATSGGMGVASVASIANPFGIVMHRPSLFGYIPAPKKRKKHKNNK